MKFLPHAERVSNPLYFAEKRKIFAPCKAGFKPALLWRMIWLTALLLISACAALRDRTVVTQPEIPIKEDLAKKLLSALESRNQSLETFKGVGNLRLWKAHKRYLGRVAWIGAVPTRLRFELLDVSGRRLATVSSDGEWFYLLSHIERRFYRRASSDPSLKQVVSIPVTSGDLILFLTGRIPIREHHSISVTETESEYMLILKSEWGFVREKIFIDPNRSDVRKIEIYNMAESLVYRAEFDDIREVPGGYRIPFRMKLSDENGDTGFQLSAADCWFTVPISPSTFVLSPIDEEPMPSSEFPDRLIPDEK
ncbi:MAG: hypothetical protein BWK80_37675 [Desulfobacteraceae bacterium IS3]|nr:MAG: hypothetical protein BWK80_37675 [Desulfobacteraceae bacterium IS3]